jgi:hypothetical protein
VCTLTPYTDAAWLTRLPVLAVSGYPVSTKFVITSWRFIRPIRRHIDPVSLKVLMMVIIVDSAFCSSSCFSFAFQPADSPTGSLLCAGLQGVLKCGDVHKGLLLHTSKQPNSTQPCWADKKHTLVANTTGCPTQSILK